MGRLKRNTIVRHINAEKARKLRKLENAKNNLVLNSEDDASNSDNNASNSDNNASNSNEDALNSDNDIPIIDNAYDLEEEKAVETVFEKLAQSSRWRYTGNSNRTRQRKLRENKIAAKDCHQITQFFHNINNINRNNEEINDQQSDYESENDLLEGSL
ncbi:10952_t:CDS:1 [Ambispora gerdemannii]|uniref:10952_t:CDS:1 n=1 Tax=Ambispora gerdemannii TaxID=144530 RepID=A0A9N8VWP1_9GLOM|nr:10952_t:CDS:1 [Ambispora gerdemannii]